MATRLLGPFTVFLRSSSTIAAAAPLVKETQVLEDTSTPKNNDHFCIFFLASQQASYSLLLWCFATSTEAMQTLQLSESDKETSNVCKMNMTRQLFKNNYTSTKKNLKFANHFWFWTKGCHFLLKWKVLMLRVSCVVFIPFCDHLEDSKRLSWQMIIHVSCIWPWYDSVASSRGGQH